MKPKNFLWIWLLSAALGLNTGACIHHAPTESPSTGPASKESLKLDAPFEPSATEVVEEMLKMAGVNGKDQVYDLGCGDGRVVITAAKKTGARGVGVDLDPQRIRESVENARRAGVAERVKFFQQDLFQADIRRASVVMLYLWPEVNLRLRPKLLRELKPGTRVVSHSHDMGTWEADQSITATNGHKIYFWVIPANVSGTWEWEMAGLKDKERWLLRLQQSYQKVSGTLLVGAEEMSLQELELKGSWLQFAVEREIKGQIRKVHFEGRVKGHLLEGTMEDTHVKGFSRHTWRAKRDPSTAIPWE
jgi:SAM-dependent methyltransferase